MFGYVYRTTNLINGKRYIGKHRSKEFDKKYYGSGKHLKSAIKKYGLENFKIEILSWCSSNEELALKEVEFIKKENPEYNIWYMPQEYSDNQYKWEKGHIPVNKGIKLTKEQKEFISIKTKEAMAKPEVKAKSYKGSMRMKDSDKREQMRKIMLERMTPEYKNFISEQTKKAMTRPGVKEKISKNTKKAMACPETRLNLLLGLQRKQEKIGKNLNPKFLKEIEMLKQRKEGRLTNESE